MNIPFNRVLALSPHADDIELGAGGTIARLVREGAGVYTAIFSLGNPETGAAHDEFVRAADVFGLAPCAQQGRLSECRHFYEHRQKILDLIIGQRKALKPDLVIAPSMTDTHQDHLVIAAEAIRACKGVTLWAYEQPWNTVQPFHPSVFVELTAEDVRTKIRAVQCYESQSGKPYTQESAIGSIITTRGLQAGVLRAEAFEVVRWVL